jgi:hypothetical protein
MELFFPILLFEERETDFFNLGIHYVGQKEVGDDDIIPDGSTIVLLANKEI